MDKLTLEEKTSVLKKLEEVSKCPICLNLLRPPLWYCVNGHCICMACKGSLTTCPSCRGSRLQKENNITLEEILNCLPRPCRFHGCNVFELEQNLKLHESDCTFRKITCPFCKLEVRANSVLEHIKNVHSESLLIGEEGDFRVRKFKTDEERFIVFYAAAYNRVFTFHSCTDLTKRKYKMFVSAPTEIDFVNDFYSTVIFSSKEEPDIKFQFTQKVFSDDVEIKSAIYSETCMTIPLSEMPHFINRGDLCYSYKIFRKRKT